VIETGQSPIEYRLLVDNRLDISCVFHLFQKVTDVARETPERRTAEPRRPTASMDHDFVRSVQKTANGVRPEIVMILNRHLGLAHHAVRYANPGDDREQKMALDFEIDDIVIGAELRSHLASVCISALKNSSERFILLHGVHEKNCYSY
jgi:hypothetical protein